ncbi:MAG: thiamine-phosphate kinase [Candidatus Diapherotrites archaeon]
MPSVEEIGGEFALIERISKILGKPKNKAVVRGIGDDCAVIKIGKKLAVFTVDCLVEGDHFSLEYFTPREIGMKAIEINASDVYSMNAKPAFALISLILPAGISTELIEGIYKGMRFSAKKHNLDIVGGNITHGKKLSIDVSMLGFVLGKPVYRNSAKPGDFLCVSGPLGGSTAGLNLFLQKKKGFEKVKKMHTQPKAKPEKALKIAPFASAMEDVSDGLASEARNICKESKCAAIIFRNLVPVLPEVQQAAIALKMNAVDFALFGGEDFEMVFTVPPKNIGRVKGFIVGKIIRGKGVFLQEKDKRKKLEQFGYDHFIKKTQPKGLE